MKKRTDVRWALPAINWSGYRDGDKRFRLFPKAGGEIIVFDNGRWEVYAGRPSPSGWNRSATGREATLGLAQTVAVRAYNAIAGFLYEGHEFCDSCSTVCKHGRNLHEECEPCESTVRHESSSAFWRTTHVRKGAK